MPQFINGGAPNYPGANWTTGGELLGMVASLATSAGWTLHINTATEVMISTVNTAGTKAYLRFTIQPHYQPSQYPDWKIFSMQGDYDGTGKYKTVPYTAIDPYWDINPSYFTAGSTPEYYRQFRSFTHFGAYHMYAHAEGVNQVAPLPTNNYNSGLNRIWMIADDKCFGFQGIDGNSHPFAMFAGFLTPPNPSDKTGFVIYDLSDNDSYLWYHTMVKYPNVYMKNSQRHFYDYVISPGGDWQQTDNIFAFHRQNQWAGSRPSWNTNRFELASPRFFEGYDAYRGTLPYVYTGLCNQPPGTQWVLDTGERLRVPHQGNYSAFQIA